MKKAFLLALLVSLVFLSACASDEDRGPSEDVIMTGEVFELIEKARKAYVAYDIKGMQRYFTDEGYAAMVRDVKRFESVELTFTPRWVDIKADGQLQVQVAWEGTWDLGEEIIESRDGMVTFIITQKPYKIAGLKMTSPFAQPDAGTMNKRRF